MSDSSDDEAPLKRRGNRRKLESDSDAEPEVEPKKQISMRPKRNGAKKRPQYLDSETDSESDVELERPKPKRRKVKKKEDDADFEDPSTKPNYIDSDSDSEFVAEVEEPKSKKGKAKKKPTAKKKASKNTSTKKVVKKAPAKKAATKKPAKKAPTKKAATKKLAKKAPTKKPVKKKVKTVKGDAALNKVLNIVNAKNVPMNYIQVFDNLKKTVGKTDVRKFLDKLADDEQISRVEFKKNKVYFANQVDSPDFAPEVLEKMAEEVKAANSANVSLRKEIFSLKSKIQNILIFTQSSES